MRSRSLLGSVLLGIGLVVVAGCSDDSEGQQDQGTLLDQGPPDVKIFDDVEVGDGGEPACGPGVYPCGPYGTNAGDVAADLEFLGYADPQNACKDHKDKVMDTSQLLSIAFKDWHQGDASCPEKKKKLLWVMVSAGWCGPCQLEVDATQKQYAQGAVDSRLGILNIVFETDNKGERVSSAFLQKWIGAFNLTFPVAMDPSFKMGAYFSKAATPFNMLVETETGKIYYRQVGGDLSDIGNKIDAYFKSL